MTKDPLDLLDLKVHLYVSLLNNYYHCMLFFCTITIKFDDWCRVVKVILAPQVHQDLLEKMVLPDLRDKMEKLESLV